MAGVRGLGKGVRVADERYFVGLEITEAVDEDPEGRVFMRGGTVSGGGGGFGVP